MAPMDRTKDLDVVGISGTIQTHPNENIYQTTTNIAGLITAHTPSEDYSLYQSPAPLPGQAASRPGGSAGADFLFLRLMGEIPLKGSQYSMSPSPAAILVLGDVP